MTDLEMVVKELLRKASQAQRSEDALRYSQAALNAAHTKHALAKHP